VTGRLGIDVGGTKCLGVVLGDDGQIVRTERRLTPRNPDAIIDTLAELVHSLSPSATVGVGVPGLVTRDGVLRAAPNLVDISDFRVGQLLSERLGMQVYVDNDATCAAAAEWRTGVARGASDVVMVTLGTGIGGGIIAGGVLQRGANGFAGEIGHMVVQPDGPPCPCGRRGCWERFASGSGLGRLAREAAIGKRLRRVVELAGGDTDSVRGEDVQAAAREGDPEALEVIDLFGRWVALGLVNLTNVVDPEMFVLGGGLAASGDLYLGPIQRWFTKLLYAPEMRPHPSLSFATLGEKAGAVGAALLPELH
jgi:glucokinase